MPLDLVQPFLRAHVIVRGDAGEDVGVRAVQRRVAPKYGVAERVRVLRQVHMVAGLLEPLQRVEQRGEHSEIGGGAGGARIGREVEQHGSDLAVCPRGAAQAHELFHTPGEHACALQMRDHEAGALHAVTSFAGCIRLRAAAAAAIGHGHDAAIELRNGHHDGRLDRK